MNAVIRTVMLKELRESLRDRRTLMTSMVLGPIFAPLFFILVLKLAQSANSRSKGIQTHANSASHKSPARYRNDVPILRLHGYSCLGQC
mgnify:CR=1 FL=1